ncbi:Beta-glucosidase [Thalictrum thalictroides]|uniref:Beta-glucosidase n=1 Tax=Thalictrum thalictroides TaxID=46969 RepID=A0A7J6X4C2_THATH|nr:Beta-glucosidase [Thalictrum thalictroides]
MLVIIHCSSKKMLLRIPSACFQFLLLLLNFALVLADSLSHVHSENTVTFNRNDFPPHFVFGAGTSAYQVEGAAAEDGRTPSVWDTIAHSEELKDKSNGDVACDQYHRYKYIVLKDDMPLLSVYSDGKGPVNPKGLQYYNNLIDELLRHGIQPYVTLFHHDLPQALEDDYNGWLSEKIVDDFTAYADVCFKEFGDRVSYWTTMNEPNAIALGGYDRGTIPPMRCSYPFGANCTKGNSTVEPYIFTHNSLLAHASAARLYKRKYQAQQKGFIGLNMFATWLIPRTDSVRDVKATQRAYDLYIGWFINPLVFGDYPETMKMYAGSKIPTFTPQQSELVKGSFDFLSLNYYTIMHIMDDSDSLKLKERDVYMDMALKRLDTWDGGSNDESQFPIDPLGLQQVLEHFKQVYGNPPIYIHENGQRTLHNASLKDTPRIKYLAAFIGSALNGIRNGSDMRGYFTWSFLDLFELTGGEKFSFGLYYVNFSDPDLKRHPKLSAHWYSGFLKGGNISSDGINILEKSSISGFSQ